MVAGAGGFVMFKEGKKVKTVEGVPVKEIVRQGDVESGLELRRMDREEKESPINNEEL